MDIYSSQALPKISVIIPFYNASGFVMEAIDSVLNQSYQNFELLLVNDGSTDNSKRIVQGYSDKRIRYFEQENNGVAAARNIALSVMNGDFFCFLDADDTMPPDSLRVRVEIFLSDRNVSFVDGHVIVKDSLLKKEERRWWPDFEGNPLQDLAGLTGKSFFGGTWMVRREVNKCYRMHPGLSHSEDLLFYMELARDGGLYTYTNEVVLVYRNRPLSAMKNLEGLENGYRRVFHIINGWAEIDRSMRERFRVRSKRIMFRSYLRGGLIRKAFRIFISWP